jgi:hypothetical protein
MEVAVPGGAPGMNGTGPPGGGRDEDGGGASSGGGGNQELVAAVNMGVTSLRYKPITIVNTLYSLFAKGDCQPGILI